jgi:diaminopimelate decarboxylase
VSELPYRPSIWLEPGRGLVSSSMMLVTRVIARVQRAKSTWLYLDAGA